MVMGAVLFATVIPSCFVIPSAQGEKEKEEKKENSSTRLTQAHGNNLRGHTTICCHNFFS
jgi:hypothetical protein